MSTFNRLASSLPSTNSLLVSLVKSSRTSVRRSFSCATALADKSAEKNKATASWSGARTWNKLMPKRAKSPTSRINCVPVSTSQAVIIRINKAPP